MMTPEEQLEDLHLQRHRAQANVIVLTEQIDYILDQITARDRRVR
ncbi:hypothetical protein [Rhodococcus sp. UNC363MFTsu5.1]|nr:hypothetical protein [Rhodococcus sp. UNC363MFTsu5.1]